MTGAKVEIEQNNEAKYVWVVRVGGYKGTDCCHHVKDYVHVHVLV